MIARVHRFFYRLGIRREDLPISLVHFRIVIYIRDKDSDLDYFVQTTTCAVENVLKVLEGLYLTSPVISAPVQAIGIGLSSRMAYRSFKGTTRNKGASLGVDTE